MSEIIYQEQVIKQTKESGMLKSIVALEESIRGFDFYGEFEKEYNAKIQLAKEMRTLKEFQLKLKQTKEEFFVLRQQYDDVPTEDFKEGERVRTLMTEQYKKYQKMKAE